MDSKDPVRLRKRTMPSGRTSLYLDIYMDGKRSYEYLKLYLIPERSRADKEHNRQMIAAAETVRAARLVEIRSGKFLICTRKHGFIEYFTELMRIRVKSKSSEYTWKSLLMHIKNYDALSAQRTLDEIDKAWILGFKDYLDNEAHKHINFRLQEDLRLSDNTKNDYLSRLKTCMRNAYNEGLIPRNPFVGIVNYRRPDSKRMYLTQEELRRLAATPCPSQNIRSAFLFACLTGLRYSDVSALTWGEVHRQGEFTRIIFQQRKTSGQEYLDINAEAAELMGERDDSDMPVFRLPKSEHTTNAYIAKWCAKASITDKHITFHCARHTFATMMLDLGTDLYTVSKLLGHRSISATQVYTKVLDKNKQKAMLSIPNILHSK